MIIIRFLSLATDFH